MLIISIQLSLLAAAQEYEYTYSLFTNSPMPGNWFYSSVLCQGGSNVRSLNGRLPVSDSIFHTPGNSLELRYRNVPGGNWEAFVSAGSLRGKDHFKKPAMLSFWILNPGERMEVSEVPVVCFIKRDSTHSVEFRIPVFEAGQWEHILIPLDLARKFSKDYPTDILGIIFSQPSVKSGGNPVCLYIDDIELLPEGPAATIWSLRVPPALVSCPFLSAQKGISFPAGSQWNASCRSWITWRGRKGSTVFILISWTDRTAGRSHSSASGITVPTWWRPLS